MKPRVKPITGSFCMRRIEVRDDTGVRVIATNWDSPTLKNRGTPFDWRDSLRVGDVLRKGRSFRVVREALYRCDGYLNSVDFAIQACSRYQRPYTIYNRNDLKQVGYTKTGVRVRLDKPFDAELLKNIRDSQCRTLFCWDTVGIVA